MNALHDSDPFLFTCSECGNRFEPGPDTMLETHWSATPPPELGMDELSKMLLEAAENCECDEVPSAHEIEFTEEQKEALARGETIISGAICICKECQDKAIEP